MAEQYSWSTSDKAAVMSAFFLGYIPMQLGGAILSRRYGAKRVLTYGAFLWSAFTALTPVAANWGMPILYICRVGMGLSEGVAFPSIYHFLASWIPAAERGRAVATFIVGVHVGTTTALIISPKIIAMHSWQMVFYSFGSAGLIWIFFWTMFAYDKVNPAFGVDDHNSIELTSYVDDQRDATPVADASRCSSLTLPKGPIPAGSALDAASRNSNITFLCTFLSNAERRAIRFILTSTPCLAVCVTQFLLSFCHFVILSWLPSYFHSVFGVKTASLSFTCMPYVAMAVFANFGGWAADALTAHGIPLTRVRKLVMAVSCSGAAIFIAMFACANSVPIALVCITTGLIFISLATGGYEASYLDIACPALAGTFKSVANTLGAFGGFLAMPYTTLVLWALNDSWRGLFATLSLFQLASLVVFLRFSTSKRLLVENSEVELVSQGTDKE